MSFSSMSVRASASFCAVRICEALDSVCVTLCLAMLVSRRGRSRTSTTAIVKTSPA